MTVNFIFIKEWDNSQIGIWFPSNGGILITSESPIRQPVSKAVIYKNGDVSIQTPARDYLVQDVIDIIPGENYQEAVDSPDFQDFYEIITPPNENGWGTCRTK